jgi:hypothetical protein
VPLSKDNKMVDLLVGVVIGLIIGWNLLPQPQWVSDIFAKIKGWFA